MNKFDPLLKKVRHHRSKPRQLTKTFQINVDEGTNSPTLNYLAVVIGATLKLLTYRLLTGSRPTNDAIRTRGRAHGTRDVRKVMKGSWKALCLTDWMRGDGGLPFTFGLCGAAALACQHISDPDCHRFIKEVVKNLMQIARCSEMKKKQENKMRITDTNSLSRKIMQNPPNKRDTNTKF
ncbi:hypothetical protein AVEN_95560-1 [Araneus ventricosus]|uniref:Uncharacterized protein n=1 Tax=Araneus ventricosus TaxID=182803 RepID=A0A4Y2S6Q9_ARAVE|nr:hypothetical protein AVEN_95560-1 [Araneus ventricosus]